MSRCVVSYNGRNICDTEENTPVPVTYDGQQIATVAAGTNKTLNCLGKLARSNIVIGTKTLLCSGKIFASNIGIQVASETSYTWKKYNATKAWSETSLGNKTVTIAAGKYVCFYRNNTELSNAIDVDTGIISWTQCQSWGAGGTGTFGVNDGYVYPIQSDNVMKSESRSHTYSSQKFCKITKKTVFLAATLTTACYQVSNVHWERGSDTGQTVTSTSSTAYPDNGYKDGYWYVKQ